MSIHEKNDVVVIGGGAFGCTLASLLADAGSKVTVWVRQKKIADEINQKHTCLRYLGERGLSSHLRATLDLGYAVKSTKVILVAIPAQSFREVSRELGGFIEGDQVVVHATKGIELKSFDRMSEILRQETCARKIGVLSGPNLAKELVLGLPSGALIASRYPQVCRVMQDLFLKTPLRLYRGRDVIGTEVSGAFKNIIAFAVGLADGMGFKDNTKALLTTRGYAEMVAFGVSLGADKDTFAGLAGMGDLMATCGSPLSRNRSAGKRVGMGEDWREVVASTGSVTEGIATTKAVHEKAKSLPLRLEITAAMHDFLYEGLSKKDLVERLMAVPVGVEMAKLQIPAAFAQDAPLVKGALL